MYIAAGHGADNPRGQSFDVNRNLLSLRLFATSFKKIPLKSDFILSFFHDFIHVYSPGARADNSLGTKFWCQQEHLVTSLICYKLKKKILWSLILYFFFIILYMYIALEQGQTAPRGHSFDVNKKALSLYPLVTYIPTAEYLSAWQVLGNLEIAEVLRDYVASSLQREQICLFLSSWLGISKWTQVPGFNVAYAKSTVRHRIDFLNVRNAKNASTLHAQTLVTTNS